jgi:hypothetical protein
MGGLECPNLYSGYTCNAFASVYLCRVSGIPRVCLLLLAEARSCTPGPPSLRLPKMRALRVSKSKISLLAVSLYAACKVSVFFDLFELQCCLAATRAELRAFLAKAGAVRSSSVTRNNLKQGFALFSDAAGARRAVSELSGTNLGANIVTVTPQTLAQLSSHLRRNARSVDAFPSQPSKSKSTYLLAATSASGTSAVSALSSGAAVSQ